MNTDQKKKIAFLSQRKLPNGWKVYPSRSRPNLVYYYNTITRETTWDPPFKNYDVDVKSEISSVSSADSIPIKADDDDSEDDIFPEPKILPDVIDLCDTTSEDSGHTNIPVENSYNNSKTRDFNGKNSSDTNYDNEEDNQQMGNNNNSRGRNKWVQHLNVHHKIDLNVNLQTGESSAQERRARGDTRSSTTTLPSNIDITLKGEVRNVPQRNIGRSRTHFEEHILPTVQRIYNPDNTQTDIPAPPGQDKTPAATRLKRLREEISKDNHNVSKKARQSSESSVFPQSSYSNSQTLLTQNSYQKDTFNEPGRQISSNKAYKCKYSEPVTTVPTTSKNIPSTRKSNYLLIRHLDNESNCSSRNSDSSRNGKEKQGKIRKEKRKEKKDKSHDTPVDRLSSDSLRSSRLDHAFQEQEDDYVSNTENSPVVDAVTKVTTSRDINTNICIEPAQSITSDSSELPQRVSEWLEANIMNADPSTHSVSLVHCKEDNPVIAVINLDSDADSDVMEWEPVLHEPMASYVRQHHRMMTRADEWYVVIDTNVLIRRPEVVDHVINYNYPNGDNPILVIPYQVMKELDNLKMKEKSVAAKARRAIKLINEYIPLHEGRMRVQTRWDAGEYLIPLDIPDDKVLQCCCQLQERGHRTVLVTNDINLRNMAIACGLKAVSEEHTLSDLGSLKPNTYPTKNDHSTATPLPRGQDVRQSPVPTTSHEVTPKKPDTLSAIIADFEEIMKNVLSKVLEFEMKRVFDEKWIKVCYRKPPWSLTDILDCFLKHWIALFHEVLQFSSKINITTLRKVFSKRTTPALNFNQWSELVNVAVDLLVSTKCSSCQIYISEAVHKLEVIWQRFGCFYGIKCDFEKAEDEASKNKDRKSLCVKNENEPALFEFKKPRPVSPVFKKSTKPEDQDNVSSVDDCAMEVD